MTLPTGWREATLGDVCAAKPQYGWTTKSAPDGRGARYLRITDITDGVIDWSAVPYCIDEPDTDRFRLVDGDIVVARSGATFGRSVLVRDPDHAVFASYLIRLRANTQLVSPSYLAWFMKSAEYWRQAVALSTGIAQPNLNARNLGTINIPLAPSGQQHRIVAVIEEQFSRLDAAVALLESVAGRLDVLEARISEELLAMEEPAMVALIDTLSAFADCAHRTPRYSDDGEFRALRPRDVVRGVLDLEGAARVDSSEYEMQTARHTPRGGDIVYSRELSYGWAAVLPDDPPVCLSQGMVALTPSKNVDAGFLAAYLNSAGGRRQAAKAAVGTAHPHINLRDIRAFRVPRPSHARQRALVREVERVGSMTTVVKASVEGCIRQGDALRASILNRAFRGLLVEAERDGRAA